MSGPLPPTRLPRGLVLPLLLLFAWWLAARLQLANPHLLVPPTQVLAAARRLVTSGGLWINLGRSLARDLSGVVLGGVAGVVVGGALGWGRGVERVVGPTLNAGKQVALFAWIPLISVWFGFGEAAKVVFIALAAFHPMVLNTCQGVRAVAVEHVEVARVLRFSRAQILLRVIVPAAAPALFTGLRLALVYAWLATIGAEYFLMAGAGIGHLIIEGREQFRMEMVLLGLVLTGTVGFALDTLVGRLQAAVLRGRRAAL